jgi:hypothetical protein
MRLLMPSCLVRPSEVSGDRTFRTTDPSFNTPSAVSVRLGRNPGQQRE